jgi:hypothetical protein
LAAAYAIILICWICNIFNILIGTLVRRAKRMVMEDYRESNRMQHKLYY